MISLVIPMYNEEAIIESTIKSIIAFMDEKFGSQSMRPNKNNYEVIFVNDGSRDATLELAQNLVCDNGNIKVISYEQNRGKGCAVRTGMLAASGDIIFFTDCDLAYGLDVICEGVTFLSQNPQAGILVGSRRKHKEGFASYSLMRKSMSLGFFTVLKVYGGIKQASDSQSGIKGFRREAAHQILPFCEIDGWSFDFEMILIAEKLGIEIIEMPVKIINHGSSKVNIVKDSVQMLRDIADIKKRVKNI